MNWYLILYIFAAIVIGTYPTMIFFQGGRTIAAIVYIVLALIVLIMFGLRWFAYGGGNDSPGQWPPIINACPDYLTYFKRPSTSDPSGTTPTCIDMVGVSRNATLAKWRHEFSMDNPPEDDKYYFSLVTTSENRNSELCARAIAAGLTWEGITNGESCYTPTATLNADGSPASNAQCS